MSAAIARSFTAAVRMSELRSARRPDRPPRNRRVLIHSLLRVHDYNWMRPGRGSSNIPYGVLCVPALGGRRPARCGVEIEGEPTQEQVVAGTSWLNEVCHVRLYRVRHVIPIASRSSPTPVAKGVSVASGD